MPPFHDYCGEKPDDPRVNEEQYAKTFHTPHTNKLYNYPGCTSEQLYALQHFHAPEPDLVRRWRPRTLDKAPSNLKDFLAVPPSDPENDATRRLDTAWKVKDWTPDVAIKAFSDIDIVYFGGQLKGRCRILWRESDKAMFRDHTNRIYQVASQLFADRTSHGTDPVECRHDLQNPCRARAQWTTPDLWHVSARDAARIFCDNLHNSTD